MRQTVISVPKGLIIKILAGITLTALIWCCYICPLYGFPLSNLFSSSWSSDLATFGSMAILFTNTKPTPLDLIAPIDCYTQSTRNVQQDWLDIGMTTTTQATGEGLVIHDEDRATTTYVRGQTGCGKSRFLLFLMMQEIRRGRGFTLIDPTGSIYDALVEFLARTSWSLDLRGQTGYEGFDRPFQQERRKFLQNFILLDFSNKEQPYRYNPLFVNRERGEKVSEVVEDFMRTVARYIGDLSEMRRLKNLLESTCKLIAEGGGCLLDIPGFLEMNEEEFETYICQLQKKAEREGWQLESEQPIYALRTILIRTKGKEKRDLTQSTINALGVWLSDPYIERFVDCKRGNIDFDDILNNGRVFLVKAQLGASADLTKIIGNLVSNKLQRQAYRRTKKQKQQTYHLYGDEAHVYIDQDFSTGAATLRQFGLRCTFAHQDQNQPPFNTLEGRAILDSIMANSTTKIFFRMGPQDALECAKHAYVPTGECFKEDYIDITQSRSHSHSWSMTLSVTESFSKALSKSKTTNFTTSDGHSISVTKGEGVTRSHAKGTGITVTKSETATQTVNASVGLIITEAEGQTHIVSTSQGSGHAESESRGHSHSQGATTGQSTGVSIGYSSSFGPNAEPGISPSIDSMGLGDRNNVSHNTSKTTNRTESSSNSFSESFGSSTSSFVSESEGLARAISRSTGNSYGLGAGEGKGRTDGEAKSETLSESIANIDNLSRAYAKSLTRSQGHSTGETGTEAIAIAKGTATGKTYSESHTKATKIIRERFSMNEEFQRIANKLQCMPRQQALIVMPDNRQTDEYEFDEGGKLNVIEIKTWRCDASYETTLNGKNYLQELKELTKPPTVPSVGYNSLFSENNKSTNNDKTPEGFEL